MCFDTIAIAALDRSMINSMESRRRRQWRAQLFISAFFLFFTACALSSISTSTTSAAADVRCECSSSYCYSQISTATRTRRQLRTGGGPGSYPPRCTSKCGSCTPCFPVHVPVPPGTPVTTEYYPEAWRCKCGSQLFMP